MSRKFNKLVVLSVVVSMMLSFSIPATALPVSDVAAQAPVKTAAQPQPVVQGTLAAASVAQDIQQPQQRPQLIEAPDLPDGLTADDLAKMSGYEPHAIRDLQAKDAAPMMIVQLTGEPLATYAAAQEAAKQVMSTSAMQSYVKQLEQAQAPVKAQLTALGVKVVANYTTVYNGFLAQVPADQFGAVLKVTGVVGLHRAPKNTIDLSKSVPLIGAPQVWQSLGIKGEGMTIAVIDSGIDYTHGALGGSGDPDDYANNNPDIIESGTFPTAKVVAGYDFAGTTYNADPTSVDYQPIPHPDNDPLDEGGHGTHVSSIATGNAFGQVSSGVAPMAKLMALKVFGAEGSTDLVIGAIDMVAYNHLLYGWPQVANLSLGSSYGPGDTASDPELTAYNNAVTAGVIMVGSSGNSANIPYITGSPNSTDKSISVASSTTGWATAPTIGISGTTYPTQTNIIYAVSGFSSDGHFTQTVTAPLAYVGVYTTSTILCSTAGITPTNALVGKVALIERGTCSFTIKVRNAKALGAIGAIIFNNAANGNTRLTMADDGLGGLIPAGFVARQDGLNLLTANGQTIVVSAENVVKTVVDPYTPADTISTFSSRGPRGTDSKLKPEITAPGTAIFAAKMGSGNEGVSFDGTSMAAPHVAGVAALVKQAHPDWTPEQVKAAMMNTATDLIDGSPIPRQGAGRVDAYRAANTKVVAVGDADFVSISDPFYTSANQYVMTRTVTVYNDDTTAHTYTADWELQGASLTGVSVAFLPSAQVTVPAGGSAQVTAIFTFDTTQIPADFMSLEEIYGYVTLTPPAPHQLYLPLVRSSGGTFTTVTSAARPAVLLYPADVLKVPFYFVPRPYNTLSLTAQPIISNPLTVTSKATITLTQSGPISSSLWAFPVLVTDPLDTGTPGDVKAVGMDLAGAGVLGIAIDAWAPWHTAHYYFTEFDLYVDNNEDGINDYVLYNSPVSGGPNYLVTIKNLATGTSTTSPYLIYTDYNSGYMEWYVPVSALGLSTINPSFNFQLIGFDGSNVDATPAGSFDYVHYPFGWSISNDPGPANHTAKVDVWVNSLVGYNLSQPKGVMVVDYTGNPHNGGEVYVQPITLGQQFATITLMHTNDFHGNLELSGSNPGIARLGAKIKQVRNELGDANTALLDAGDIMQSSLLSNLKKGQPTIDLYNYLGYDAATYGNHEFDWGQQVLISRTKEANFPFVVSNLVVNNTGNCATAGWTTPVSYTIKPWITMTVGAPGNQAVIGILGTASIETPYITIAEATQGLCFKDPAQSIAQYYNAVKAAGADVIVILSHNGNTDGGYGYGFTVEGDQTLARKLVQQGTPANIIIGGHSHTDLAAAQVISGTTVVQAHYAGRKLGRLDLVVNTAANTATVNWTKITVGTTDAEDAGTKARVNVWAQDPAYLSQINQVVGFSNVDLVRNYNGDNLVSDLVNDSIYNDLNTDAYPANDVDIVFNNAGGLRSDITSTTKPFTLTYGLMYSELPFGNATLVGSMKGWQIMELLNQSATLFKGAIQVSGIRYAFYNYTDTLPGPQPYAWGAYSVTVKQRNTNIYEPLVLTKTYSIATNEFLAPAGQDGYVPFKYTANYSYTYWGDMLDGVNRWVSKMYSTTASAYNGPNGNGLLDGRVLQESSIIPVTLLHHNDSHGRLLQSGTTPGYTNLATAINQERAHNPGRSILLSAGDNIQGDTMMAYYKTSYTGFAADGTTLPVTLTANPLITAFNAMTYTAYTLGNHEFNFGNAIFTNTLKQANYPILQANLYDTGAYGIAQVPVKSDVTTTLAGGIKVAVLGIGNHRVPNYEMPSDIAGLAFTNPITEAQTRAPALKASNDIVVALTHIGFTEDPTSVEVDANVDTNLAATSTGIDTIIGGHSHTPPYIDAKFGTGVLALGAYKYLPTIAANPNGEPVLINQANRYNTFLGEVIIGVRPKAGGGYEVVSRAGRDIELTTASYPEDARVKAIVKPYDDFLTTYKNQVFGQTKTPIDTLLAFTQETNGANLQVDASLWKLNKELSNTLDIDFHLSGAMTNAKIAAAATVTNPYTMTVGEMFTLMPYENALVVFELNGAQLKSILERGYRNYWYYKNTTNAGGYSKYTTCMLDVSAGGVITYQNTISYTPGIDYVLGMTVNGVPIDFTAATTYTVSTVNYIAAGSCNFNNAGVTMWPPAQLKASTQYYVRDVVIEYVPTLLQPINPQIEGRLVFLP